MVDRLSLLVNSMIEYSANKCQKWEIGIIILIFKERIAIFAKKIGVNMETTQIKLDKNVVDKAIAYAHQKGVNLSSLIEDYLNRLIQQSETEDEAIPDIVLSLLGAGQSVDEEDINGREAYQKYLEEKYR